MIYRCPNGGKNKKIKKIIKTSMKKLHEFPASYIKFIDKLIQLLFSELQTNTTTTTTTIIRHELGPDSPLSDSSNSLCGPPTPIKSQG
jgi:hypothetical protein